MKCGICGICGSENVFPGGSWSPAKCRDCGAVEVIDIWEPGEKEDNQPLETDEQKAARRSV